MALFLLILILSLVLGFISPWWISILIAFVSCLLFSKSLKSAFLSSFFSIFILWFLVSMYHSITNNHILAKRVSELFGLGASSYSWFWIVLLAAFPGAITAGFAGVVGFLTKQITSKNN